MIPQMPFMNRRMPNGKYGGVRGEGPKALGSSILMVRKRRNKIQKAWRSRNKLVFETGLSKVQFEVLKVVQRYYH